MRGLETPRAMTQVWDRVQGIALFGICCLLKCSVIVKSERLVYSILLSLFLRVRYVDHTPVKRTVIQSFPRSRCNLAKAEESRAKTAVADIINSSTITCNTATQFHVGHPVPTQFCVMSSEY